MSLEIVPYADEHLDQWDEFCAQAINATLLHTRRFLGYHGDRFKDRSLLIFDDGKLVAVMPAAESPGNDKLVVSHPGATYGGIVHRGKVRGMRMLEAMEAIERHYGLAGYRRMHYKAVPHIYASVPAQDDLYALFRRGAVRVRADLSSTIDLANQLPLAERRRRSLKKAVKSVQLSGDIAHLAGLWGVVAENLSRKHEARPVHSMQELEMLASRFPDQIGVRSALIDGVVEAGVVLFSSPAVWHAQYIAASEKAYEVSALDAVFDACIAEARAAGARYFDFGTSNEEAGTVLNDGLYRFKTEFGGGGVIHEYYDIELKNHG